VILKCHICPCPGPNTLVGLAKPADASAPFDHDAAIKALLPAYIDLLTNLKALGVPEVQMHEPILTTSDAAKLKGEFESSYSELAKVGVPINLVSPFHTSLPADHSLRMFPAFLRL
jgi:5-methyltetrahydropteroyltriglutamate--homocysteine methyltransferase